LFEPFRLIFILLAGAAGFSLLVYAIVYAGGGRKSKRYRPGRPFEFRPVWFVAAPERQARAGISAGPASRRELVPGSGQPRVARPMQTGGASDRW
jgi:hypothetical protein